MEIRNKIKPDISCPLWPLQYQTSSFRTVQIFYMVTSFTGILLDRPATRNGEISVIE